jgi:hypothetical protein
MTLAPVQIPLTDYFDAPDGRWTNYDAYDTAQRDRLLKQRHRDIRSFVAPSALPVNMYAMADKPLADLEGLSMSDVGAAPGLVYGEEWSRGVIEVEPDRWHWSGLTLACPVGTTQTTSVTAPVDLWSDFTDDAIVTFALPDFPASKLRLANFDITFATATDTWTVTPFASPDCLAAQADGWATSLVNGDSIVNIPRYLIWRGVENREALLKAVTTVTLRFVATAATTVRLLAIRLVSPEWTWPQLDINTLTNRVERSPHPKGTDDSASMSWPRNNFDDEQVPWDWPILFKAYQPSGTFDPRPLDISEAVVFGTGAMTTGELRLYFRESTLDLVTQLDLDNADGTSRLTESELASYNAAGGRGATQRDLEALGRQLDFDVARYHVKVQADLDPFQQQQLDTQPQYNLEAKPDTFSAAWVEVRLAWSYGVTTLTIRDTEGNGYDFDVALDTDTRYAMLVDLQESDIRVRIYATDDADRLPATPLFDSNVIRDDFLISRRAGRVGWYANFLDGNAYLDSVRAYNLNFGEYRSVPFRSITPVIGGQVFFGGSPPEELVTGVDDLNGGVVTPDRTKSNSGVAYRVDTPGSKLFEGFTTNEFHIDNFRETVLSFNLWVPSDIADGGLTVFLVDRWSRPLPLNLGRIEPGHWQPWRLDLTSLAGYILPSYFRLQFIFDQQVRGTFYVDAISLRQQTLAWHGRAQAGDAWGDNASPWMPFGECVNGQANGILFPTIGTAPQVRALARRQNANLSQVKFLPQYAPLGRLVWSDQTPTYVTPQMSGFTATVGGRTATFGLAPNQVALGPNRFIVYHEWDFGDGESAVGPTVTHTYPGPGIYPASVLIVDNQGSRGWYTQNVTVS